MLSEEEKERYSPQVLIPGWNQEKLKQANVLVVGLDGLSLSFEIISVEKDPACPVCSRA